LSHNEQTEQFWRNEAEVSVVCIANPGLEPAAWWSTALENVHSLGGDKNPFEGLFSSVQWIFTYNRKQAASGTAVVAESGWGHWTYSPLNPSGYLSGCPSPPTPGRRSCFYPSVMGSITCAIPTNPVASKRFQPIPAAAAPCNSRTQYLSVTNSVISA
jgi:hypothetical protein